jgi:hypothetical protein
MTDIIREKDRIAGPLTEEEKVQLKAHADLWIQRILRTDPIEPDKIKHSIKDLYRVSDLAEPYVAVVTSPVMAAFAGGAIAAVIEDGTVTDEEVPATVDRIVGRFTVVVPVPGTTVEQAYAALCKEIGGSQGLKLASQIDTYMAGGNMWAQYDCLLTAMRDVLGLDLPEHVPYKAWEECAIHGSFRWLHEKFCLVSDFPEAIRQDEQFRPHCDDGPSHRWRDGWELFYVHGVRVPPKVVLSPETLTAQEISDEVNAEVRRVMLSRFGLARYVKEAGFDVVCEYPEDHPLKGLRTAQVIRKEQEDDEPIVVLDMLNSTPEPDGTTKRYTIRVDPNAYDGLASEDCLAAMASTYRLPDGSLVFEKPEDYQPAFES